MRLNQTFFLVRMVTATLVLLLLLPGEVLLLMIFLVLCVYISLLVEMCNKNKIKIDPQQQNQITQSLCNLSFDVFQFYLKWDKGLTRW